MARKRYKPEEIVAKLRQVDVLVSQGQNMGDAGQGAKNARNPPPRAAAGHAKRRGAVRPAGVTARGGRHYGPGYETERGDERIARFLEMLNAPGATGGVDDNLDRYMVTLPAEATKGELIVPRARRRLQPGSSDSFRVTIRPPFPALIPCALGHTPQAEPSLSSRSF